jgi:hypothetical protein
MVSIWLTKVKGRRESSRTEKIGFSAYSAKVVAGFAIRIRAILAGAFFLRQTGFHFAGKSSVRSRFS